MLAGKNSPGRPGPPFGACRSETPEGNPMSRRQLTRPLSSYLLRIQEEHVHSVVLRYELQDLAAGTTQRFASLAALQRHLRALGQPASAAPAGKAKA